MTHRRRKRLLVTVDLGLLLTLAAIGASSLHAPLDAGGAAALPAHPGGTAQAGSVEEIGPLADYAAACGRNLRKPLYDPKPAPLVKPEPAVPRLDAGTTGSPGSIGPLSSHALAGTIPTRAESVSNGRRVVGGDE